MNSLLTPGSLDRAVRDLPETIRAEVRTLGDRMRRQVVDVLAEATNETELDLREDSAAQSLSETTLALLSRLSVGDEKLEQAINEAVRQTASDLERWVRKIGSDLDIYAARTFERTWQVMSEMGRLLLEIEASEIEEITSVEMSDPVMRDLLRAQAYALTVATLADEEAPLPRICTAMCARAHRALASYIRFVSLLDPRESGLVSPRYRPLRHDAYRTAEKVLVEQHFQSEAGTATQSALDAALARQPEIIE